MISNFTCRIFAQFRANKLMLLLLVLLFAAFSVKAQVPTITSFTPASAKPGDVVTITGTNFNTTTANNVVFFGATKATVTAATATSLTVTVPTGATYDYITELNTTTSLATQSLSKFTPVYSPVKTSIGTSDFDPKVDFTVGNDPFSSAIGDLDGDGKPDLVITNGIAFSISVFRNTSSSGNITSGSFASAVNFATGNNPYSVAIKDIDGDGKPDILVGNYNSNTISIFRNMSSSGTINSSSFASAVNFATGTAPSSIAIRDLDGDGKPDIVISNLASNTVSVFRNTSSSGSIDNSSFATKVDYTAGTNPTSVVIGDLDGDGKPDIAVANYTTNNISVFHNISTVGSITSGSFAAKVDFTTGTSPNGLVIGDFDGDGKADLATANRSSNTVSILRNTATSSSITTGSFASKVDFTTGTAPYAIAIGDFDGDGKVDLATANRSSNTVSILRNTTTSGSISSVSFASKVDYTTANTPNYLSVGDLDGDGMPDLLTANDNTNNISILRNANLPPPTITSFSPSSAKPGDAVTITGTNFNTTTANNVVFFGATKATVTAATATSLTVTVPTGATYDYITELNTTTSLATQSLSKFTPVYSPVKTSIGTSDFDPKVDSTTGTNPYSVAIGDIDGDGKSDLAIANYGSNTVSVLRNTGSNGTVSFASKVDFATGTAPYSVAIGDIDGDGKPDLAIANYSSNTVSVLRNTGSSGTVSFASNVDFGTGVHPRSVSIGDLDGDGKPDLAIANFSSNTVSVLRNTGSSGTVSFATKVDFTTGSNPASVAIGDIDGDGKPDLVITNIGAGVSVLRNTGSSGTVNFAGKLDFATGIAPYSVAIGDIDGDGKPDLAIANRSDNTVSILRNTSSSGTVSFAGRVDFGTGNYPYSVAIGDIDGDGKPDLVTANSYSNTVSVLRNTGSSGTLSFANKVDFSTGSFPFSVAIGDLDGDGKPDLAAANQSSNTVSVLLNVYPPVITESSTLTAMSTTYGTASASQSFQVSGAYMQAGILITPPTGFEVSADNTTFSPTITVGSSGTIASTTVYVRLSATAAAGAYNGNIVLSSTNAANVNVATVSSTVNKKDLSITGIAISNKVYDGNTTATITGTASLNGVVGSDAITLGGTASATFNSASVGTTKAITVNGYSISGTAATNYALSQPVGLTADITSKALTITGISISNKVYDGTTTASLSGTPSLSGIVGSDAVSFNAAIVANFDTKNVGTGKAVTVSGFSLTGTDAGNYSLNQPTGLTGDITQKSLTVTATGVNKVYDGNTSGTVTLADNRVSGDVLTASYTAATFDTKNVGTGKTVSVAGISISGTDAGNYTVNTTATTTANITAKALTVTATGVNKTYDGNTTGTVTLADNRVTGDVLTASYTGATFDTKNVGTSKTVSVTGVSISGTDAGNYTVNTTATTTANITQKSLTVTASGVNKTYDGNTTGTVTLADNRVTGDVLTAAYTAATFDSKNVGTGKTVSVTGISISGTDAGNYTFNTTAATTANITAKALTITADDKSKFTGTANPKLTASYSGFVSGEDQTVLTTAPTLSTTATISSPIGDYPITASGAAAQNYSITYVNGTLHVKPGAPTSVSLAATTLYENRPAGTLAGTLSSTSDDPNATFTYTLVSGTGATDNGSFTITGNQLQTAASLNYEAKSSYQVRVRSTTQYGFYLEQTFIINLNNVNEAPTLNAIADQRIYFQQGITESIALQNLTAGPDFNQTVQTTVQSNNPGLFQSLAVNNNQISYIINDGQTGAARITITVKDNGGTANGGVDQISRTFNLQVDASPVVTGTGTETGTNFATAYSTHPEIGKGLSSNLKVEAADAQSYSWNGIGLSSYTTSNPVASPTQTTTYYVMVTNSKGFSTTVPITVSVRNDYVIEADNNFTPNGDGINDTWKVKNIESYPDHELIIFDQGGRILYKTRNYQNDWNGTVNGKPLDEGTYYYIFKFDDPKITKITGFITIVK